MKQSLTPPQTSKPKSPSPEAIARAAFVDKTYVYKGQANASV